MFNLIAHAPWAPALDGARALDAFAGSGALGFEAMSRGAAFCLFIETDAAARGAIRENAERLGVLGAVRVHRRDAAALGDKPAGLGAPFTLAFLDPPYGRELAGPTLARLCAGGWLAPEAAAIVETGAREPAPEHGGFTLRDERVWGAARVWFFTRSGEQASTPP